MRFFPLLACLVIALSAQTTCLADDGEKQASIGSDSELPNPWQTTDMGNYVFHDSQRPYRLFDGIQIELGMSGGFQIFWEVNPLFGVNPFLTPYAGVGTTTTQTGTLTGTTTIVPAPMKKPDNVISALAILGFTAEVRPYERPLLGGDFYWSLGGRFELANQLGDYPFNREEWYLQLLARAQSTPQFSNYVSCQGKFLLGLGNRSWLDTDLLFTVALDLEGSLRVFRDARDSLFARLGGRFSYEEDGVVATMSFETQVGWRRVSLPAELINEMRIFGILRAADRRDYSGAANLNQQDFIVGVGTEVRLGPIVFTGELSYYFYNRFTQTPLQLPPNFQGSTIYPNNFFAGVATDPLFTQIDTPGLIFSMGARVEF